MNAPELMIGNYVYDKKEVVMVFSLYCDLNHTINNCYELSDYKGIKLSSKWLEDFGFHKFKHPNNTPNYIWAINNNGWLLQSWKKPNEFYQLNGHRQIKYVHELQNLFYAITGNHLLLKGDVI